MFISDSQPCATPDTRCLCRQIECDLQGGPAAAADNCRCMPSRQPSTWLDAIVTRLGQVRRATVQTRARRRMHNFT